MKVAVVVAVLGCVALAVQAQSFGNSFTHWCSSELEFLGCTNRADGIYVQWDNTGEILFYPEGDYSVFPLNLTEPGSVNIAVCSVGNEVFTGDETIFDNSDVGLPPLFLESFTQGETYTNRAVRIDIWDSFNYEFSGDVRFCGGDLDTPDPESNQGCTLSCCGATEATSIGSRIYEYNALDRYFRNSVLVTVRSSFNVNMEGDNVLNLAEGNLIDTAVGIRNRGALDESCIQVYYDDVANVNSGSVIVPNPLLAGRLTNSLVVEDIQTQSFCNIFVDKLNTGNIDTNSYVNVSRGELMNAAVFIAGSANAPDPTEVTVFYTNATVTLSQVGNINAEDLYIINGQVHDEVFVLNGYLDWSDLVVTVDDVCNVDVDGFLYLGRNYSDGEFLEYDSDAVAFVPAPAPAPGQVAFFKPLRDSQIINEIVDVSRSVQATNINITITNMANAVSDSIDFIESELADEILDIKSASRSLDNYENDYDNQVRSLELSEKFLQERGVAFEKPTRPGTSFFIDVSDSCNVNTGRFKLLESELLDETMDVEEYVNEMRVTITHANVGNVVATGLVELYGSEFLDEIVDVRDVEQCTFTITLTDSATLEGGDDLIIGRPGLSGCTINGNPSGTFTENPDDLGSELLDETFDVERDVDKSKVTISLTNVGNAAVTGAVTITESELVDEIVDMEETEDSTFVIALTNVASLSSGGDVLIACGELLDETFDCGNGVKDSTVDITILQSGNVNATGRLNIVDGELVDEIIDISEASSSVFSVFLGFAANAQSDEQITIGNPEYECRDPEDLRDDLGSELLDEIVDVEGELEDMIISISLDTVANAETAGALFVQEGELLDETIDVGKISDSDISVALLNSARVRAASAVIKCGELVDEVCDASGGISDSRLDILLRDVATVQVEGRVIIELGELTDEILDTLDVFKSEIFVVLDRVANINANLVRLGDARYDESDPCLEDGERGWEVGGAELTDEILDVAGNIERSTVGISLTDTANIVVPRSVKLVLSELTDEIVDVAKVIHSEIDIVYENVANIEARNLDLFCSELMDEQFDIGTSASDTRVSTTGQNSARVLVDDAVFMVKSSLIDETLDISRWETKDGGFDSRQQRPRGGAADTRQDGANVDIPTSDGTAAEISVSLTNVANIRARDLYMETSVLSDEILDAADIVFTYISVKLFNVSNIFVKNDAYLLNSLLADEVVDVDHLEAYFDPRRDESLLELIMTFFGSADIDGTITLSTNFSNDIETRNSAFSDGATTLTDPLIRAEEVEGPVAIYGTVDGSSDISCLENSMPTVHFIGEATTLFQPFIVAPSVSDQADIDFIMVNSGNVFSESDADIFPEPLAIPERFTPVLSFSTYIVGECSFFDAGFPGSIDPEDNADRSQKEEIKAEEVAARIPAPFAFKVDDDDDDDLTEGEIAALTMILLALAIILILGIILFVTGACQGGAQVYVGSGPARKLDNPDG